MKQSDDQYEVVWSGGELMPPAPQELYELFATGRRSMTSLGLIRWGDGAEVISRDAAIASERQKVPMWRKRQRPQRKTAKESLRPEMMDTLPHKEGNWSRSRARLSDETVRRIRRAYANGEGGYAVLGKRFGLSNAGISAIVHNSIYKHVKAEDR